MKKHTSRDACTSRDAHVKSFHNVRLILTHIHEALRRTRRGVYTFSSKCTASAFFLYSRLIRLLNSKATECSKAALSAPWSRGGTFALPSLVIPLGVLSIVLLSILGFGFSGPGKVEAAINEQLNFQARLLTSGGSLVPDGNYNVQFKIYSGGNGIPGGGDETLEWTGSHLKGNSDYVRVVNGYLSAQLGSSTSQVNAMSDVDWNASTLWLAINVGDATSTSTTCSTDALFITNCGGDGEMNPYMRLTSTPYAFNSNLLDGLDSTNFVKLAQGEQAVTTNSTLIALDVTGTGAVLDLQVGNSQVLGLSNGGNLTVSGSSTSVGVNSGTGLIQGTGGLTVTGTTNIGATAGNGTSIGNATGTFTLTGSSASSFILNGQTVSTAEFNVLDAGIEAGDLTTQGTPTDEWCLTYESTSGALLEWQACGGGSSLFTQGTNFGYLTTTGDNLTIGANTDQSAKLAVVGDADDIQLLVKAHSTQTTNNILEVQSSGGTTLLAVDGTGNVLASNASTATTGTTEATARTNVTTVTLTAAGSFANNDIIHIDNAGTDYYTRIVSGGGTTTLTVSPAVSYDISATVTKYNAQNLGATSTDYATLSNRFFEGYFLGGVKVGTGTTTLSDGNLNSTGSLVLQGSSANVTKFGGGIILDSTDAYINFNSSEGTSGYGIRDSSGTLQFKDSGGSWSNIADIGGTGGADLEELGNVNVQPLQGESLIYKINSYPAATGATMTASSESGVQYASLANDADTGTYWASTGTANTSWIKFDFGAGQQLAKFNVNQHGDTNFAASIKLYGSDNNSDWTLIDTFTGLDNGDTNEFLFGTRTYRYWRLDGADSSANWSVDEITAYDADAEWTTASFLTQDLLTSTVDVESGTTVGEVLQVIADALTTGSALSVSSDSGDLSSGNLVDISTTGEYDSGTITGNLLNVFRDVTSNDSSTPTVTYDTSTVFTTNSAVSSATHTYSHTVSTQSNRVLIVGVATYDNSPTSVTFNGTNLTKLDDVTGCDLGCANGSLWYLINPPVTTANVVITLPSSKTAISMASNFYNVDQTTPLDTPETYGGTGSTSEVVASTTSNLVLDFAASHHGGGSDLDPGAGQTQIFKSTVDSAEGQASYEAGATSVTMSNVGTGYGIAYLAVDINAVASGGLASSGAVVEFSSDCTEGTGTCTDSSPVLLLNQMNPQATGDVLTVFNAGTGRAANLVTSNTGGEGLRVQIASSSSSQKALQVIVNGGVSTALAIDGQGTAVFSAATNTTASFQVQDAFASEILTVDSTNRRVYVGDTTADATGDLFVLDTKNTTGDPTGVNGAMYYNSFLGKFRCYEAGQWKDCIANNSGGVAGSSGTMGVELTKGATSVAGYPSAKTVISWDTEVQDDSYYWADGNPTYVTAQRTGWHELYAWISGEANTTHGDLIWSFEVDSGSGFSSSGISMRNQDDAYQPEYSMSGPVYLNAGDKVQLIGYHDSAVTRTYSGFRMSMVELGGGGGSSGVSGETALVLIDEYTADGTDYAEFTDIPADLTGLKIVANLRSDSSSSNYEDLGIRLGDGSIDTGATNYYSERQWGASSGDSITSYWMQPSGASPGNAADDQTALFIMEIGEDYADSTNGTMARWYGGRYDSQDTADQLTEGFGWYIPNNVVDQIRLFPLNGTYWEKGTVKLYGYKPIDSSGGGASLAANPIDVYKSTVDTPDDEFNTYSLDPKWTAVSGSAGTIDIAETGTVAKYDLATRPGTLFMQASSANKVALRQDYTLADGDSIVLAVSGINGFGGTNNRVGLTLNDNDTSNVSGNALHLMYEQDNNTDSDIQWMTGAYTGGNTFEGLALDGKVYFRVVRTGLVYSGYISNDGVNWSWVDEDTYGGALTNIWIQMDGGGGTKMPTVAVDWIREGGSGVDPWDINWRAGVDRFGETLQGSYNNSVSGDAAIATINDKDILFQLTDTATDSNFKIEIQGGGDFIVDRTAADGTLISLRQAGVEEGTISVSMNTVSYNAFTGSHYGWNIADNFQKGQLVSYNSANEHLHDNQESEVLYGFELTNIENDPKVFGSYLSVLNPLVGSSKDNPHLIMAVGNGELWIVNEGQDIEVGDYLISSSTNGHARLDPRTDAVSYVVARAAEDINWSNVTETINGKKHTRVSVTFETFTRDNLNSTLQAESLDIVNSVSIGGNLTVASMTSTTTLSVTGTATINKLSVTGTANINNLIAGTAEVIELTVIDKITTQDLYVNGHIISTGETPIVVAGEASGNTTTLVLGTSQTAEADVSVEGNDIAGTITVVTGEDNVGLGEVLSLQFIDVYNSTPRIVLTAGNSLSSQLDIYRTSSEVGFTVNSSTVLQPNTTYIFDYFIIE